MKYYFTLFCFLFLLSCEKPMRSISALEGGSVTIIEIEKDIIEILYPTIVPPTEPEIAVYHTMCQEIIKNTPINSTAILSQNQTIYYKILRSFFDDNASTGVKIFINNNNTASANTFQPENLPDLITSLKIREGNITLDIQKLLCLKDIQVLNIENTELISLDPLIGFTKIRELHITGNDNLLEIQKEKLNILENLQILNLSNNQKLSDISAIQKIPNLTHLDLSNNQFIDFSKINIYKFPKIQKLNLKNTNLNDAQLNTFFTGTGIKPPLKDLDLSNLKLQKPFNPTGGLISFMNGHNMESIDFSGNTDMIDQYSYKGPTTCPAFNAITGVPNSLSPLAAEWNLLWKTKVKKVILGGFKFAYCIINPEFYKHQEEIGAIDFEIVNEDPNWLQNEKKQLNTDPPTPNTNHCYPKLNTDTKGTPNVYYVLFTLAFNTPPKTTKIFVKEDVKKQIYNLYTTVLYDITNFSGVSCLPSEQNVTSKLETDLVLKIFK